jgi:hypothetical protein
VGLSFVEPYGLADTLSAENALCRLLAKHELTIIDIDTRLDSNLVGMRTPAEVESAIARVDVMLTTRLHGMVMALKHGVPVIAIDPEPDGGKIIRQARCIGWPFAWAEHGQRSATQRALDHCLTPSARTEAREALRCACERVDTIERTGPCITARRRLDADSQTGSPMTEPVFYPRSRLPRCGCWQIVCDVCCAR